MNATFKGIPTLSVTGYAKAIEFYVDLLGFTIDWEHRFAENEPVYMQVSKNGLVLHLSENPRFRPGTIVFVETTGLHEYYEELAGRKDASELPGITITDWRTQQLEIEDPFGNLLRYNEALPSLS